MQQGSGGGGGSFVAARQRRCRKPFAQPREAARQGRSVLFSDEQKLLFEGSKKGFAKNTKSDFMRRQLHLE
jgi:hypothetical protein